MAAFEITNITIIDYVLYSKNPLKQKFIVFFVTFLTVFWEILTFCQIESIDFWNE